MNIAQSLPKVLMPIGLLFVGLIAAACQGQPLSQSPSPNVSPAIPGALVSSGDLPEPTVEYLLSDMPRCPGMEKREAFPLDWPDMENAQEKLADYHWGYYRCDTPQPALSQLYRSNMDMPPYLWREVNHAEHNNGIVVLFYHPVKVTWIYLWMLPGPEVQSSYLVISRSDPGEPQAWECRLSLPETLIRANKGG
jgi:hypothetical protein